MSSKQIVEPTEEINILLRRTAVPKCDITPAVKGLMQNIHELRKKNVLSLFFTELGYKKYFPKYFLISDFQI